MKNGSHPQSSDNSVQIQDIICAALPPGEADPNPTGEFNKTDADQTTQLPRMYASIKGLVKKAAQEHLSQNCDSHGQLKSDCKNNITRLTTNEFLFFTKAPLTLKEFAQLQKQLNHFAAKQPENLHLILGSFAVKTPDNQVMSVVPHIECGPDPKVNLIVKNYPSAADPVYKEKNGNRLTRLENVGISIPPESLGTKGNNDKLAIPSLVINGKKHPFSFNNVLTCQTAGGEKFFSCVDICYDHNKGAAKNRLEHQLQEKVSKSKNSKDKEPLPELCSHVVTSNSHNVLPSKKLVEAVAHSDPVYTPKECKKGAEKKFHETSPPFGTPVHVVVTNPMPCEKLSAANLDLIRTYNASLENKASSSSLPSKIFAAGKKSLAGVFNVTQKDHKSTTKPVEASISMEATTSELLERFRSTQEKIAAVSAENEQMNRSSGFTNNQSWVPKRELADANASSLKDRRSSVQAQLHDAGASHDLTTKTKQRM